MNQQIAPWHGCPLVNLLDIFITPFPQNTSGGPLLKNQQTVKLWLNAIGNKFSSNL